MSSVSLIEPRLVSAFGCGRSTLPAHWHYYCLIRWIIALVGCRFTPSWIRVCTVGGRRCWCPGKLGNLRYCGWAMRISSFLWTTHLYCRCSMTDLYRTSQAPASGIWKKRPSGSGWSRHVPCVGHRGPHWWPAGCLLRNDLMMWQLPVEQDSCTPSTLDLLLYSTFLAGICTVPGNRHTVVRLRSVWYIMCHCRGVHQLRCNQSYGSRRVMVCGIGNSQSRMTTCMHKLVDLMEYGMHEFRHQLCTSLIRNKVIYTRSI